MLVTGVQAVGAKGVTAIQGAVVDIRDTARSGTGPRDDARAANPQLRSGVPQPVVFPRQGLPVDQRPVALRRQHAAARYQADGGDGDLDGDAA
jgi:hypothetical protein